MKNVFLKTLSVIILAAVIFSVQITSCAEATDAVPVTLQPGDTIIDVCDSYGVDYYQNKTTIMQLNGIIDENRFNFLKAGDTVLIPGVAPEAAAAPNVSGGYSEGGAVSGGTMPVTVAAGDTIIGLCAMNGIDYYQHRSEILQLNGFTDESSFNYLKPGDVLTIPVVAGGGTVVSAEVTGTAVTGNAGVVSVTVQAGDTFRDICARHGVDFNQYKSVIMKLNGITDVCDLNTIKEGQSYLIPSLISEKTGGIVSEDGTMWVEVRPNDTIISICAMYNIDYYQYKSVIMQINGITDESFFNYLKVGDKIKIPASASYIATLTDSGGYSVVKITVQNGETLKEICARYGTDYDKYKSVIMQLNGISDVCELNSIKVGEEYKIPSFIPVEKTVIVDGTSYYVTSVTVQKGETLKIICARYGIDFDLYKTVIMELNHVNDVCELNTIKEGQKFLIPSLIPPRRTVIIEGRSYYVETVFVQKYETLKEICRRYGIDFNLYKTYIMQLNGISDVCDLNTIKEGDKFLIPVPVYVEKTVTVSGRTYNVVSVTVQRGQTLTEICRAYGFDYEQYKTVIMQINGITDVSVLDNIKEGTTICIPSFVAEGTTISASGSSYHVTLVTLQGNETLEVICKRHGFDFEHYKTLIMQLNGITDVNRLIYAKEGDTFKIPSFVTPEAAETGSGSSGNTEYSGTVSVKIEPGDTLREICAERGIDYNQYKSVIMQLNGITDVCDLNSIKVGDTFLIPTK